MYKDGSPDIIVNSVVIQYAWESVLDQDIKDYKSQFDSCVMQNVLWQKPLHSGLWWKYNANYIDFEGVK